MERKQKQKTKNQSLNIKITKFKKETTSVHEYAICEYQNSLPYMEDMTFFIDGYFQDMSQSALFGVFDGHNGDTVCRFLTQNLPKIIKEKYQNRHNHETIQKIIQQSFQEAQIQIQNLNLKKGGSTATIGLILIQKQEKVLYIAQVGDSSAYLFDEVLKYQKIIQQHNGDNQQEINRIIYAGGKIIRRKLCGILGVTRAFGDCQFKQKGLISIPEIKQIKLNKACQYLIIASDGIWPFVLLAIIKEIIQNYSQTDKISISLTQTAIKKYSNDNISVIVIKLKP